VVSNYNFEEWGDDHGYVSYHCPVCHKQFYSDSGPRGQCCQEPEEDNDQSSTAGMDMVGERKFIKL
jgi:hypothetical protein